jgi:hypothetical protein
MLLIQLVIAKLKMIQAAAGKGGGAKDGEQSVLDQLSQALLGIPELSRALEGQMAARRR